MSLSLENATGLTAQLGNAVWANSGGANTNVSTTNATTASINGRAYTVAAKAAAAATATDAVTGAAFKPMVGGQACVIVAGYTAAGALVHVQGPVVSYDLTSPVAGQTQIPLPTVPADFCPLAYQVIKNKNTAGTASWTFAVSNFNAANLSFETAVQLTQMPNAAVYNASA